MGAMKQALQDLLDRADTDWHQFTPDEQALVTKYGHGPDPLDAEVESIRQAIQGLPVLARTGLILDALQDQDVWDAVEAQRRAGGWSQ